MDCSGLLQSVGQESRKRKNKMEKKIVSVRGVSFGEGRPKICIPVMAEDSAGLEMPLKALDGCPYDFVEWRADYCTDPEDPGELKDMAARIRENAGQAPILFTLRTEREGGCFRAAPDGLYEKILLKAASMEEIDLVDVELFTAGDKAARLTGEIQEAGCRVIGSSHDFSATPSIDEMIRRLTDMQQAGMDITKLAVMPVCRMDVIRLLELSVQMEEHYADRPFITMSMGSQGMISRISGNLTGSAVTFGSGSAASAPGQLPAKELASILKLLG